MILAFAYPFIQSSIVYKFLFLSKIYSQEITAVKMNSWVQMSVNSNGEEVEVNDTDESNQEIGQINYKQQYVQLKKKLKLLLFVSGSALKL